MFENAADGATTFPDNLPDGTGISGINDTAAMPSDWFPREAHETMAIETTVAPKQSSKRFRFCREGDIFHAVAAAGSIYRLPVVPVTRTSRGFVRATSQLNSRIAEQRLNFPLEFVSVRAGIFLFVSSRRDLFCHAFV
jgi:hypothetical protein